MDKVPSPLDMPARKKTSPNPEKKEFREKRRKSEPVQCNCGSMFTEVVNDKVVIIHYAECAIIRDRLGHW